MKRPLEASGVVWEYARWPIITLVEGGMDKDRGGIRRRSTPIKDRLHCQCLAAMAMGVIR
jgi:hypothetical protein